MIDTRESMTAKLCSFARAYHSNNGRQKIFDDYLAFDIMGSDEYNEIGQLIENDFDVSKYNPNERFSSEGISRVLQKYISPIPLSRIAFAEEKLMAFAERYGSCQYVICGAGMDTFSFRNPNPKIQIFELDHPDTGRYKQERIKQLEWNIPDNVTFVPINFETDNIADVLLRHGFRADVPSFFAILGVTYYLTPDVLAATIGQITQVSRAGSELVFDYPDETLFSDKAAARVSALSQITEKLGEKMQHGYSFSEIYQTLEKNEFEVEDHVTPQVIQQHYFDNRQDALQAFENINLILAEKRKQL